MNVCFNFLDNLSPNVSIESLKNEQNESQERSVDPASEGNKKENSGKRPRATSIIYNLYYKKSVIHT